MEIEKQGLNYKITCSLPKLMVGVVLFSFQNKFESIDVIGGNDDDSDINQYRPYEYEITFYFKKDEFNVVNGVINWVKVVEDFLKTLRMVENIFILQPNKEVK